MNAWFGFLSAVLLFAALGAALPASLPRTRWINAAIFAGLSLIPLPGTDNLAMWLHALIGVPSATLVQLAALTVLTRQPQPLEKPLLLAFVLIATEFLVLALGVGQLDVYAIGYHSPLLIVALFPLGLWLFHGGKITWLTIIAIDLLAYGAGLYPNLWDALMDPVLLGLAIVGLCKKRGADRAAQRS